MADYQSTSWPRSGASPEPRFRAKRERVPDLLVGPSVIYIDERQG